MPFRLPIENILVTPSYQYCLPHLSGETVPGSCYNLCLVLWLLSTVVTILVLGNERGIDALPVDLKVLLAASVEVP